MLASHLLRANRGGEAHIACVTSLVSSRSAFQRLREAITRPITRVPNYERKRRPASDAEADIWDSPGLYVIVTFGDKIEI